MYRYDATVLLKRTNICVLSQLGLVASLIQFKCTKYFRDDLTLVIEDAQCSNSISEPS